MLALGLESLQAEPTLLPYLGALEPREKGSGPAGWQLVQEWRKQQGLISNNVRAKGPSSRLEGLTWSYMQPGFKVNYIGPCSGSLGAGQYIRARVRRPSIAPSAHVIAIFIALTMILQVSSFP